MKKHIYIFSAAALSLLAFNACMKQEMSDGNGINSDLVSFAIDMSKYWNNNDSEDQTKSAGNITLFNEDGDSLYLSLTVADSFDGLGENSDQMAETKGVQVTGSNLSAFKIGVNAFHAGTTTKHIDDQLKYGSATHSYSPGTGSETSGHWVPVDDHQYYWPKAHNLDFWAWAPYEKIAAAAGNTAVAKPTISAFGFGTSNNTISFNYDLGVGTSASDMPDLMFAKNLNLAQKTASSGKGDGAGCVPLEFKHALAAVKFKVSADFAGTVSSIEIGSAVQKATCTYPNASGDFAWTNPTSLASGKTFKQTFTTTEGAVSAKTTTLPYHNETVGTKAENSAIFMMIPQDLTAKGQTVSITFNYTGKSSVTYTGYLDNSTISEWKAGHAYIYTITIPEIGITVEDEVTTSVKSNLVVKNTGNTNSYVRATIVANWVNEAGRIVAPWKESDGNFTNLCTSTSGWVKVDGFYYQKNKVAPNGTAPKLFDKYTVTSTRKGVHLEMGIIVQAITAAGYTDYKDAWKQAAGLTL